MDGDIHIRGSHAEVGSITPAMLPLIDLEQQHIDAIVNTVPGGVDNVQDIYPLSSLQEGLLFHRLMNESGDTYVLSTSFEVESRARVNALVDALRRVVDRHDVLRSAVLWENLPRPVQVVYRQAELPVVELVLDEVRDPLEQLSEHMRPGSQTIDLRRAPLGRLSIATVPGQQRCYALLQLHHLVCDHQSLRTVVVEAIACLNGAAEALPRAVPYRDYVAHVQSQARPEFAEAFFRAKLAGIVEPTAPFELTDVHRGGAGIEEFRLALEPALADKIRKRARAAGVSPARMVHAAWALVLAQTTGRDDVVFGTVLLSAQRRGADAQRMLGMTVNTLPLRLQLQGLDAQQLLERTSKELTELRKFEHASLALAQRASEIAGTLPLFTTLLNFRHGASTTTAMEPSALGLKVLDRGEAWSNYPIAITVDDTGEGFVLLAQADERIGSRRIVDYLRSALLSLVTALEQGTQQPVLTLPVLPEAERQLLIERFNATQAPNPPGELVHQMFERWAEHTPDAIALTCGDRALTFAQLNRQANRLARLLRARGIRPDQRVGLYLERSVEVVAAMLAILKAGGAYVPLDTTYPLERLEHVLSDSAPLVVLTTKRLRPSIPKTDATVIALDDAALEIDRYSHDNLDASAIGLTDRHMAYVIYTSGSTGTPKGVVIEHRSLVNLIHWHCSVFDLRRGDCGSSTAALGFDAATWEIWPPLSAGARLALAPASVAGDAEKLLDWWSGERMDVSFLATPIAELMFSRDVHNPTLRTLLVGGDRLRHRPTGESFELINNYGPTEATVVATSGRIDDDEPVLHIGGPIRNTQIYILDRYRKQVPVGVAGEMYVGGIGVARGYLNRADLTAERFVPDPFSTDARARMYRTGDVARWRPDGTVEYLGRNDHQVKVRGIRIELGEIEARLLGHEHVQDAAVIAHDVGQEKRLAAYVVTSTASGSLAADELRAHLKEALPDAMIPGAFVMLDRLPLTPNGKLDRRALPVPDWSTQVSRQYQAPQGGLETTLAEIWQRVLRVARVGRGDNFFELGGHSLLIVQMMDHLRRLGLSTDVRKVFDSPTLADLAATIVQRPVEQAEVAPNLIPPGCERITPQMLTLVELEPAHIERVVRSVPGGAANVQDVYPLAPLQEGILFHHQLNEQAPDVYVLPTLLSVPSRQQLDALIAAIQQVIDRHDVLRTAILWDRLPRPVQVVYREATLPVEEVELDARRDRLGQVKEWMKPEHQRLDLQRAPLMKLRVADAGDGGWYALLQAHHIADDATSLEIVISEVVAVLNGRAHELSHAAPYRSHVARSLAYARSGAAETFFRAKLADVDQPTAPFGLLDVHEGGGNIVEHRHSLEPDWARRIRAQARALSVSAATLFHAAWGLVVARTTGQDDVVFGSVLLGRLQGNAGGQQTLGMLINTLPLRLRLADLTARALVERAQKALVELMAHEQASLAVAQRCSGISGSTPLFTSLLNYRHVSGTPAALWNAAGGIEVLASYGLTNYPITLSVDDLGSDFSLVAQTDRSIDPRRLTEYLRVSLESLVHALEQAHDTPALELGVLPADERHQLVSSLHGERVPYAPEGMIHRLFEEQAARSPQALAVLHEETFITYAELNSKANQLARFLRSRGVGPGQPVGICVERSLQMIIGLLGILKAGGAYVPLDPNYPAERLQYMLEDAAPSIVLTQKALRGRLPKTAAEIVELEPRWDFEGYFQHDLSAAEVAADAGDLLYIIYTSGSTGRPKGTAMSHRAMVNLMEWHRRNLRGRERRRVLQFAALSFDVAFQETFSTLCTGGSLILLDEWVRRDAGALLQLLRDQSVESLFVPPMMLQSLAEHCVATGTAPSHLTDVTTAGEQLRISPEIVALFKRLEGCRLHNHYGPTETHVVTALTLPADPEQWPTLPSIGRPIDNTSIYILDERRQLVPRGVVGEIYIGGANVANGYLHRPELTAERFICNPFSADPAARLYKTGDLGRWHSDGTLEYLGRNDDQVKIRGFRIELGEIEARLALHPQIRETAVLAREDVPGERVLVAYVTLQGTSGPSAEELRAHVKAALPEHMVPSAFVTMTALPLTPSGKLNRRALPAPEQNAYARQTYEAPQGEVEAALADIWQSLLHVKRVGRQDNFFSLGGHSLVATRVVAQLRDRLQVELPLRAIFDHPTLEQLAARVPTDDLARDLRDQIHDMEEDAVLQKIASLERELGLSGSNADVVA